MGSSCSFKNHLYSEDSEDVEDVAPAAPFHILISREASLHLRPPPRPHTSLGYVPRPRPWPLSSSHQRAQRAVPTGSSLCCPRLLPPLQGHHHLPDLLGVSLLSSVRSALAHAVSQRDRVTEAPTPQRLPLSWEKNPRAPVVPWERHETGMTTLPVAK